MSPNLSKPFFRLLEKLFRCSDDDYFEYQIECYACKQVGVPVFHSIATPRLTRNRNPPQRRLIIDPRSRSVQIWNRVIVLARGVALAIDPLYFFSISVGRGGGGRACINVDGGVATVASVLRSCADLVHVCHLLVRFRLAYVCRESLVVGCGKLVWDARAIDIITCSNISK